MKPAFRFTLPSPLLRLLALLLLSALCFFALSPAPDTAPDADSIPAAEKETPAGEANASEILAQSTTVIHGFGQLGDVTILNCREGFEHYYARGARVFEVDLRMTRDGEVVLRHDWRAGWQEGVSEQAVPTLEEFLSKPVLGQYTPMSFRDLLLLMEEYPDICIVTDTKFVDAEIVTMQFSAMLDDAQELGLSYLFDRMAVQVYSNMMFGIVEQLYQFPHYIYTLYADGFLQTEEAFRAKAEFCRENGIEGITMWYYWWDDAYACIAEEYGLSCYVHTVDDAAQAAAFLAGGVDAVYTNLLTADDLGDEKE